eukprot:jgi/Mesen1/9436/ME000618S08826
MCNKRLLGATTLGSIIVGGGYFATRNPGTISEWAFKLADFTPPILRLLDPENAHELAVWAAGHNILPREHRPDPPILATRLWGRTFANPLGLAAGFDKNAQAVEGLLGLGFGFVEVGSVTPVPQEGNPKPRVFRLPGEGAVINRYGFNSEGIVVVAKRLGAQHGKRRSAETEKAPGVAAAADGGKAGPGLVGVNLGKNKYSEDAASDYIQGVHTLTQFADYLVLAARDEMQWGDDGPPPLLVKIAPDLSQQDMADIAAVALALRLDGLVVGNTTVSRPDEVLGLLHSDQTGGLSGRPLFQLSTDVLSQIGEDAYKKVRAGASLVQIWTALAYEGPGIVPRIKAELAELLEKDGFASVADAVGADHRQPLAS